MMTPSHDFGEYRGGKFLTTHVALVIAVGEPCRDFSQVITSDWLTTKRTERPQARRPVIHQDKFHLPPPSTEFLQDHGSSSRHSLRLMYFARGKWLCADCARRLVVASIFLVLEHHAGGTHQTGPAFIKLLRKLHARLADDDFAVLGLG